MKEQGVADKKKMPPPGSRNAVTETDQSILAGTLNTVELRVVRSEEDFHRVQPEWDELVGKLTPTPLPLTCAWLLAWWDAFSTGMEMEFRCVYEANALIGVAPLVRCRELYRGIPVTLLKLAANGHSPYSSVIVEGTLDAQKRDQVLSMLTEVAPNEIGLFFKVSHDSDLRRFLLRHSKSRHIRVGEKPSLRTPVVDIDRSWDAFYQSRPRSLKKSLNNKLNRFRKSGDFTIDCEQITEADQPIMDELVAISANSWKASIGNDLKSNHRSRQFLRNLVESFGKSGAVKAWIIRQGKTPVAFELHLLCDEVVYPIRADYDNAFKAYSPGSVLEYSALKQLFDDGLYRQYYTCADDYWYLTNWTTAFKNFCSLEVFGDSWKLRALYFAEYHLIPLVKRALTSKKARRRPV